MAVASTLVCHSTQGLGTVCLGTSRRRPCCSRGSSATSARRQVCRRVRRAARFIMPQSRYMVGYNAAGVTISARRASHPLGPPRTRTVAAQCRGRALGRPTPSALFVGARSVGAPALIVARLGSVSRAVGAARVVARGTLRGAPELAQKQVGCSVPGGLRRRGRGEPPRLSLDVPLKAYGMRSACVRRVHSRSHLHAHAHSHACTRIRSRARTHTNAHTRPRAHARMHARTNKTPSTRAHTHRYAPAILSNNQ